jgi:kumamolisin
VSVTIGPGVRLLVLAAAVAVALAPAGGPRGAGGESPLIGGPYARLLAHSADLGAARDASVQLVVALRDSTRPGGLIGWADNHRLSVRWQPGQDWAIVEGGAHAVGDALGVAVHDYRSADGHTFYVAARQPPIPVALRAEVTEVGRILGYGRNRVATPPTFPLDVPKPGLTPAVMMTAYDVTRLAVTGKGQTIAFFEFGDYDAADLQAYATRFNLPAFTMAAPVGGMPPHNDSSGETTMDLEAAHAVAPDARLVVVNANTYVSDENFQWSQIENMFDAVDHEYPGAVWSSSISTGPCDRLLERVDAQPARSALATAESHGTSAFDAAGDTAGLECKEGLAGHWGAKPTPDDIGLDPVASLPEMTDVGGTTLSTDANGVWVSEETWVDYAMQQGTGGGISAVFDRPAYQRSLLVPEDSQLGKHRLTPDVAAVADVLTGIMVKFKNNWVVMGGTSMAAPMWAGFAALMNQYLLANGGRALGDLNPLLYRAAGGARQPAFHDVTLGGNAAYTAGPGYDLVTGLGTPDVDNLAHNILDIQKAGR